ncbi:MAG: ATP-binding protein [Candidatus Aminicenantes bacterium]|nr:ATP-binding protein [Candidatus Aminicenantes bacterium]
MLIEFKVGNFLSFKDMVTLSMVASSDREHLETNTIPVNDKLRLLKSAVLYGANASGKSNLIKAIDFMRDFILSSSKESSTDKIRKVEEFRLSTETDKAPSTFEVTFQLDNIRYRYGFQVDRERVHNEWLYYVPTIREALLFIREKDKIHLGSGFKEGKGLESKTRENALFLSVVDQFNGQTAKQILKWFDDLFVTLDIQEDSMSSFYFEKKEFREFVLKLLKVADLGLKSIKEVNIVESLRKREKEGRIYDRASSRQTIHQKYGEDNKPVSDVEFDLSVHESAGTQVLFDLAGPIYDALRNNLVLFIDELTSKLHPLLTRAVIDLFHHTNPAKDQNPGTKSQLIFACHDTNILTNQFFRRDQIWFTQKDEYGATELYSLDEYRINVRKDASFNKNYIMGKYGAIPFIGDIESLFENINNED